MRTLAVAASSFAAMATLALGAVGPNAAVGASSGAPYVPFPSSTSSGRAAPFIDALNARSGLPRFDRLPFGGTGVVIQSRHGTRVLRAVPAAQRRPKVLRRAGVAAGAHDSSASAGTFLAAAIVLIALAAAAIAGRSRRGSRVSAR